MAKADADNLSDRLIRAISNWSLPVNHRDDVEELLDEGVDVNRQHGTLLPLHCACMVDDTHCVQLLLDRGAQVNTLDGYGRSALHYAAERQAACVQLLINHNAHVNIRDASQASALHWASYKNNDLCVSLLLQNGAEVNAVELNNDTPLSWAAHRSSLESMEVLLAYNARTDNINMNGQTPLARALAIRIIGLNQDDGTDDECVQLLIEASGQFDLRKNGIWPEKYKKDIKLMDLLKALCENVRSLCQLTRYAVRTFLGQCYLPNIVCKLPIPPLLQNYLLLQS